MNSSSAREGVTSSSLTGSTGLPLLAARSTSRLTKAESLASREQQHEHRAGLDAADDLRGVVAPRRDIARRDPAGYAVALERLADLAASAASSEAWLMKAVLTRVASSGSGGGGLPRPAD